MRAEVMEFNGVIGRARSAAAFIELTIGGMEFRLERGNKKHAAILASLRRTERFAGRGRSEAAELRGMIVSGAAWLDEDGDAGELAWLAPYSEAWREPGPAAAAAAHEAFFAAALRQPRGRHPAAMRLRPGERCEDCGGAAEAAHHLEARATGGEDAAENRVPLCRGCHERRHAAGGRPRLRPGWYVAEVVAAPDLLDADADQEEVRVRLVGGACGGREYWVRWPDNIAAVADADVWRLFLRPEGAGLAVQFAEPIEADPAVRTPSQIAAALVAS